MEVRYTLICKDFNSQTNSLFFLIILKMEHKNKEMTLFYCE